jgi:hypothetical protein
MARKVTLSCAYPAPEGLVARVAKLLGFDLSRIRHVTKGNTDAVTIPLEEARI